MQRHLVQHIEFARPGHVHRGNDQLTAQEINERVAAAGTAPGNAIGQSKVAGGLLGVAHGREVIPKLGFLQVPHQGGVVVGAENQHGIIGHQGVGVQGHGRQGAPVIDKSGQREQQ